MKPIGVPRLVREKTSYPRSDLGRAIEWKSSSERRHTQRLVSEAHHLMRQGYRALLQTGAYSHLR